MRWGPVSELASMVRINAALAAGHLAGRRERTMEAQIGAWLWFVTTVVLVLILGVAIGYGAVLWRNRRRSSVVEHTRDEATRRLYEKANAKERADRGQ